MNDADRESLKAWDEDVQKELRTLDIKIYKLEREERLLLTKLHGPIEMVKKANAGSR